MKLNIHLNGFAIRKDLLTEKTKWQFSFCHGDIGEKCGNKQNHPVKIDSLYLKTLLQICF